MEELAAPKDQDIVKSVSMSKTVTPSNAPGGIEKPVEELIDIEPDQLMKGYMKLTKIKISHEENTDLLTGLVGGITDGITFGAQLGATLLKSTVGKVISFDELERQYFELKNGVLFWYPKERARRADGSLVLSEVSLI